MTLVLYLIFLFNCHVLQHMVCSISPLESFHRCGICRPRFGFRELVATTLSAMIAVLPLLLYSTGILSFVSLPANIFVLPFIPLAMLLSFCAGVFGFIYAPLSIVFGYGAHLILSYILSIIHFFASFSFASTVVTSFPLFVTIVLYLCIFWWVHNTKHA
jgi:hypothetical protein